MHQKRIFFLLKTYGYLWVLRQHTYVDLWVLRQHTYVDLWVLRQHTYVDLWVLRQHTYVASLLNSTKDSCHCHPFIYLLSPIQLFTVTHSFIYSYLSFYRHAKYLYVVLPIKIILIDSLFNIPHFAFKKYFGIIFHTNKVVLEKAKLIYADIYC